MFFQTSSSALLLLGDGQDVCQVQRKLHSPYFWGLVPSTKGAISLSVREKKNGCLWCSLAYQNACWPPGSLSIANICYRVHAGVLALLTPPHPELFQLMGFPSPSLAFLEIAFSVTHSLLVLSFVFLPWSPEPLTSSSPTPLLSRPSSVC